MNEEKTDKPKSRIVIYDWIRLIATIFVVIGHSAYLQIQTTYGGVAYELPANLSSAYYSLFLRLCRYLSGWVYGFHMPLFFILSGAVLALKPIGKLSRFVVSKIKRLIIPYYLFGWLFMLPIKYLGNFYDANSFFQAMRGFLVGIDSGHLWFLLALFWCMIVFALIQKIVPKFRYSRYILLVIGGIITLTYGILPFDVLGLKQGLSYMFWFSLGYVFELERQDHGLWNSKLTIVVFAIITVIELVNVNYGILPEFTTVFCGSFFTFLLADVLSRIIKKVTDFRLWNVVIRNLFFVYLFHDPLEYIVLRVFFGCNFLSSAFGCYLYTFCRTILIFAISIVMGETVGLVGSTTKKFFLKSKR